MISLKDFVHKRRSINDKCVHDKSHYIGDKEIVLRNISESSFETFVKDNNIIETTEDTYKFYLDSNFNDDLHIDTFNGRWYSSYQDSLYETLNRSFDSSELASKINNIVEIKNVEYVSPKRSITQFTMYFSKDNFKKLLNDNELAEKFINLLHKYNYYWKTADFDNYFIILEPYKPEEATEYIYKDCKGIIYHVTSERVWDKIQNSKEITKQIIKPNKIDKDELFRDRRSFFIAISNEKKALEQCQSIINTKQLKDGVILKVDLNKFRYKIKFRIDSSAHGYKAYFTEEPIPSYCITKIL